ncbi:MAG: FTR1 family protein [Leptospirillia bacterium]
MAGAFLILLREGFEAALIVGIILAVVVRLGEPRHVRHVLYGVAAAVLVSIGFAFGADRVGDLFEGAGEEIMNGAVLIAAAAMITYVIVWLRSSRHTLEADLKHDVHRHMAAHGFGVMLLAFLSVFREGVETVLFLWGVMATGGDRLASVLTGAALGLTAAVAIAWMLFQGGRRIPLRAFFNATTVLLVLLAGGMLAHGVGLWVAVDWLPALVYGLWDTSALLPERSPLGSVMTIMLGYNANPTLMEALAYFGYLAIVVLWIRWDNRRAARPPVDEAASTS